MAKKHNMVYLAEAGLFYALFGVYKLLPLDAASALGGWLGQGIGPLTKAHRIAQNNLRNILPGYCASQRRRILAGMWNNLGRVSAELAHLPGEAIHRRVVIHGEENLPKPGQSVIFFSGHFGNWELTYPIAYRHGVATTLLYRFANNPYVERAIARLRATQSSEQFSKGKTNGIKIIRAIKKGNSLLMLIDQKMNEGICVPFFGHDAMTAPHLAEFALRYQLPIVPARVLRTQGCHFEATIYPPLVFEKSGDETNDVHMIMTQINAILESWIREAPEQWFWVHRRWPKE